MISQGIRDIQEIADKFRASGVVNFKDYTVTYQDAVQIGSVLGLTDKFFGDLIDIDSADERKDLLLTVLVMESMDGYGLTSDQVNSFLYGIHVAVNEV